jgi:hypothetical protein
MPIAQTSKKDKLKCDPHCLSRLQERVVSVAIANIILSHAVPKIKKK